MNEKNTIDKVLEIFENGWNKQVILYGPPGTSKTYSATEIAARFLANRKNELHKLKEEGSDEISHEKCEEYLENNESYKVIQFHPSYSYEDFVRGIVVKTKEGTGVPLYEVERKIIETFGKDAKEDKPRVLVIDEINRAPLGAVLGELIYGLEYRGKAVSTPYVYIENGVESPLKISEHLYIIGTMNTADRSIGSMDYAVRRRFAFVPVLPKPNVIKETWNNEKVGEKAKELFEALMNEKKGIFAIDMLADDSIDVNDIKIGHTYFLGKKDKNDNVDSKTEFEYLRYRIDYQIRPVYEEYIKDGLIDRSGLDRFNKIVEKTFQI